MRWLFTSYHHEPSFREPLDWLRRIEAYMGIPVALAERHEVMMLEHIEYEGRLMHQGVAVHFQPLRSVQQKHRLMQALAPDIVVINGLRQGLRLAALKRMLPSARIILAHRAEQPRTGLRRQWDKLALKPADRIIFADALQARTWADACGLDAAKVALAPLGSSVFQADPSLWTVYSSLRLLFVGRLNTNKDPLCLLKAVALLREAGVCVRVKMIYQTAEMLADVQKFILDQGLNDCVELLGAVPHANLAGYYHEADVLVCCSHYESLGAVVLEALSCGCFPVCSDIPAFRNLTQNGLYGALFPVGYAEGLFRVLMSASFSVDYRRELVRYFEMNLSFEAIAQRLEALVSPLC